MRNNSDLTKYRKAFSDFKEYLDNIYYNNNLYGKEYEGYLINLKDYENIKEFIDKDKININDSETIFKINQIKFKTPQYLINMILNGNQYIFINTDLWELLCDKDKKSESPIIYKVNSYAITFNLDYKELSFRCNKNIIDKTTLNYSSNYKSDFEQIKKIYNSIIKYYFFEKKFLIDLKNAKPSKDTLLYLVSKNWFDKWKILSNFENIKNNYLQKNLNNEPKIMDDLIYFLEKNKYNYNELIDSLNFKKKEELEYYLKYDSFALIDRSFANCFNYNYNYNGKSINYKVFNNKIHIYLDNSEILSFKSNNNIISLNGIINYSNLKQLIKIYYFQQKMKSCIEEKLAKNKIYLMSKKVINFYKNNFNYKNLYNFLKSNSNTQSLNYDYLNIYYYKIINELFDNDFIEQFIQIEQNKILTEFKDIDENFIELEYKIKSPSEKNMKYIKNFEIVSNDIKDFFIENNIAKEEHFISLYSFKSEDGKILIIFEKDNKNFYEIGHFNDDEDFIIEYLIDEFEEKNKYYINDYFFNKKIGFFINNDTKDSQNIINLESKWTTNKCFYYKIEEKEEINEIISYQTSNVNNINIKDNIVDDIRDNKFVKDIFSFLLSIYIFERNLYQYPIQQINNINKSDVILLSNQFLVDFKNLFSYDKVYSLLEILNIPSNYDIDDIFKKFSEVKEGENFLRLIFENEKEFEKNKDKNKEYFMSEKTSLITNSKQNLLYPDKFCILNENIYSKINELINLNIESLEEIKFELFFKIL